jgi:hypothetical protein
MTVSDVVGDQVDLLCDPAVQDTTTSSGAITVLKRLGLWREVPADPRDGSPPGPGDGCYRSSVEEIDPAGWRAGFGDMFARVLAPAFFLREPRLRGLNSRMT